MSSKLNQEGMDNDESDTDVESPPNSCSKNKGKRTSRSRSESPGYIRDIIEGFAISSFKTKESLQEFVKQTTVKEKKKTSKSSVKNKPTSSFDYRPGPSSIDFQNESTMDQVYDDEECDKDMETDVKVHKKSRNWINKSPETKIEFQERKPRKAAVLAAATIKYTGVDNDDDDTISNDDDDCLTNRTIKNENSDVGPFHNAIKSSKSSNQRNKSDKISDPDRSKNQKEEKKKKKLSKKSREGDADGENTTSWDGKTGKASQQGSWETYHPGSSEECDMESKTSFRLLEKYKSEKTPEGKGRTEGGVIDSCEISSCAGLKGGGQHEAVDLFKQRNLAGDLDCVEVGREGAGRGGRGERSASGDREGGSLGGQRETGYDVITINIDDESKSTELVKRDKKEYEFSIKEKDDAIKREVLSPSYRSSSHDQQHYGFDLKRSPSSINESRGFKTDKQSNKYISDRDGFTSRAGGGDPLDPLGKSGRGDYRTCKSPNMYPYERSERSDPSEELWSHRRPSSIKIDLVTPPAAPGPQERRSGRSTPSRPGDPARRTSSSSLLDIKRECRTPNRGSTISRYSDAQVGSSRLHVPIPTTLPGGFGASSAQALPGLGGGPSSFHSSYNRSGGPAGPPGAPILPTSGHPAFRIDPASAGLYYPPSGLGRLGQPLAGLFGAQPPGAHPTLPPSMMSSTMLSLTNPFNSTDNVFSSLSAAAAANQELTTRIQQELNARFLQDRGLLPPVLAPFTLHTEMHQHLHHHQHLIPGTYLPPTMMSGLPGFPGYGSMLTTVTPGLSLGSGVHGAFQPKPGPGGMNMAPASQLLQSLRDREPLTIPSGPVPTLKKRGRWCAAHVHMAWKIQSMKHRQRIDMMEASGAELPEHMRRLGEPGFGSSGSTGGMGLYGGGLVPGAMSAEQLRMAAILEAGSGSFARPTPYSGLHGLSSSGQGLPFGGLAKPRLIENYGTSGGADPLLPPYDALLSLRSSIPQPDQKKDGGRLSRADSHGDLGREAKRLKTEQVERHSRERDGDITKYSSLKASDSGRQSSDSKERRLKMCSSGRSPSRGHVVASRDGSSPVRSSSHRSDTRSPLLKSHHSSDTTGRLSSKHDRQTPKQTSSGTSSTDDPIITNHFPPPPSSLYGPQQAQLLSSYKDITTLATTDRTSRSTLLPGHGPDMRTQPGSQAMIDHRLGRPELFGLYDDPTRRPYDLERDLAARDSLQLLQRYASSAAGSARLLLDGATAPAAVSRLMDERAFFAEFERQQLLSGSSGSALGSRPPDLLLGGGGIYRPRSTDMPYMKDYGLGPGGAGAGLGLPPPLIRSSIHQAGSRMSPSSLYDPRLPLPHDPLGRPPGFGAGSLLMGSGLPGAGILGPAGPQLNLSLR